MKENVSFSYYLLLEGSSTFNVYFVLGSCITFTCFNIIFNKVIGKNRNSTQSPQILGAGDQQF